MLPIRLRLAATLLVATTLFPATARTQSAAQDSVAVIRLAEQLLDRLSVRDTVALRALMAPGAVIAAVSDPAPPAGGIRFQTDVQFLSGLSRGSERLLERMWAPKALLYGTLAEVHAPYDFHIDGRFSHCGTDIFTFMRTAEGWRVVGIQYTTQRTGCAPSPLGPPR